jgi:hypothetical protein
MGSGLRGSSLRVCVWGGGWATDTGSCERLLKVSGFVSFDSVGCGAGCPIQILEPIFDFMPGGGIWRCLTSLEQIVHKILSRQ